MQGLCCQRRLGVATLKASTCGGGDSAVLQLSLHTPRWMLQPEVFSLADLLT